MVPTERALALAGPLRAALSALEQGLEPTTAFDPRTAARSFTILTNDFVALALLPRLLARLSREAPQVRLQVRAWQEHRVPPDLERGDADLMIGFHRDLPAAHHEEPLFADRFVGVVRKSHPRVHSKLTLATYLALPHLLVSHVPDARGVIDDVLAARGLSRTVALRVSHFLLVPAIVAATDYVAALSELIARPFAEVWPLQILKLPLSTPEGRVRAVWHERTHASPAHVWLRALVAEIGKEVKATCDKTRPGGGRRPAMVEAPR
jgi:DNA-binding transcriptional LysR family regulator